MQHFNCRNRLLIEESRHLMRTAIESAHRNAFKTTSPLFENSSALPTQLEIAVQSLYQAVSINLKKFRPISTSGADNLRKKNSAHSAQKTYAHCD